MRGCAQMMGMVDDRLEELGVAKDNQAGQVNQTVGDPWEVTGEVPVVRLSPRLPTLAVLHTDPRLRRRRLWSST